MDIFDRAANLFDRAQGRMADATNQAARLVLSASQVRALEARQGELRQALEAASMELGKLTYGRWKSPHLANDAAMQSLCQQIDRLNAEYQRILGDLTDARAAAPAAYPPRPLFAGTPTGRKGPDLRAGGPARRHAYPQRGAPASHGQQTGMIPPGASLPAAGLTCGLWAADAANTPSRPRRPCRNCRRARPNLPANVPNATRWCPASRTSAPPAACASEG